MPIFRAVSAASFAFCTAWSAAAFALAVTSLTRFSASWGAQTGFAGDDLGDIGFVIAAHLAIRCRTGEDSCDFGLSVPLVTLGRRLAPEEHIREVGGGVLAAVGRAGSLRRRPTADAACPAD